jgi:hypothetical protein
VLFDVHAIVDFGGNSRVRDFVDCLVHFVYHHKKVAHFQVFSGEIFFQFVFVFDDGPSA